LEETSLIYDGDRNAQPGLTGVRVRVLDDRLGLF
jgi:hypothetical protein